MTRRLVFTEQFKGTIKNGAWAILPADELDDSTIEWKLTLEGGSKMFKLQTEVERDNRHCVEIATKLTPHPEKGDFIELSQLYRSKNVNRIYKSAVSDAAPLVVDGRSFDCIDGIIPIVRTKHLKSQFRFAREYGLKKEDVFPLVGSYSSSVDYLVESELARSTISVQNIGGTLLIDFAVQSPLLRHVYGIAWRIPDQHVSNKSESGQAKPSVAINS